MLHILRHRTEMTTLMWIQPKLCFLPGVAITIFVVLIAIPLVRKKYFAWLYSNHIIGLFLRAVDPYKEKLFKELPAVKSHDPELSKEGSIRILEIGLGPGCNLKFYPEGAHLIGLDYNPEFNKYFDEIARKEGSHLHVERVICCSAEDMRKEIPDESVDVVVGTYVFCSISDRELALQEIKRVLVPGGKFFFFEHVLCHKDRSVWIPIMQQITAPFWYYFSDGCHINRNIIPFIEKAGFSKILWSSFVIIDRLVYPVKATEMGVVVK